MRRGGRRRDMLISNVYIWKWIVEKQQNRNLGCLRQKRIWKKMVEIPGFSNPYNSKFIIHIITIHYQSPVSDKNMKSCELVLSSYHILIELIDKNVYITYM